VFVHPIVLRGFFIRQEPVTHFFTVPEFEKILPAGFSLPEKTARFIRELKQYGIFITNRREEEEHQKKRGITGPHEQGRYHF
jgi:hypothetical protein